LILDEVQKIALCQALVRMEQNQLQRAVSGHIHCLSGNIHQLFRTMEQWANQHCDLMHKHVTKTMQDQLAEVVVQLQLSTANKVLMQLDRFERMETGSCEGG
jgi:hypothetical protein